MPVEPMVRIDEGNVRGKLEKLAKKAGVSVGFVCEDQLRLWTADMLRKTPPEKLSEGRATVEAGVAELFRPLETQAAFEHWKERLQKQSSDLITYTKRGKMRISRQQMKAESLRQMRTIHKAARTRRGGVSKRRAIKRAGNLAFSGELPVSQANYRAFLRQKQKMIGWLKAGWLPAHEYYARRVHAASKGSAWVRRHSRPKGYPQGQINKDGNGFVAAVNAVAYANTRISQDRLVELTQGARQRDLVRGGFKRMADLTERFNKGAI